MNKFEDIAPDGNDWVPRELRKMRAELDELRSARSAEATTIGRGGLTINDDGTLKMIGTDDVEIVYFGPDAGGNQIIRMRREDGSLVLYTYTTFAGTQYWALTDRSERVIVSDDAVSGVGLARPWLPVFMTPTFVPNIPAAGNTGTWTIDSAQVVTEVGLWEGRASISHPWIEVDGAWGHASGSGTVTYKLKVAGVEVGTWNQATGSVGQRGPFNVAQWVGFDFVQVQLTAQQTTGTGAVRCHVLGCYLTQTQ